MEINWGWGGVYEKWLNFIMCGKSQNQPQLFAFWVVVANEIDYLDKAGFAAYPCVQVLLIFLLIQGGPQWGPP